MSSKARRAVIVLWVVCLAFGFISSAGPTPTQAPPVTKGLSPTNRAPSRLMRTNTPPAAPRSNLKTTNALAGATLKAGKTNAAAGSKTGTAPTGGASSGLLDRLLAWLREFRDSNIFYPAIFVAAAALAAIALFWSMRKGRPAASGAPEAQASAAAALKRTARPVAIHSCNVLRAGAGGGQLWHFDARGGRFVLGRDMSNLRNEPWPPGLVGKDWRSLFQRKLNLAWLPPEHVFLRVAQFPASDFNELVAMAELQLEKLSPIPVAQVVWTLHLLGEEVQSPSDKVQSPKSKVQNPTPPGQGPQTTDHGQTAETKTPPPEGGGAGAVKLHTVIVMIAARSAVEEFLGQLEGQGYMADGLELPVLDQLQATAITEDGAWIYPEAAGGRNMALVAWWYGGALRNLDLLTLPAANRGPVLREQLTQMAWAGELEGWLSGPPRWHLVADGGAASEWEAGLREGLEQPIQVLTPPSAPELAAMTARRAARAQPGANLLPAEFATRYRQQLVDRLWIRGLFSVGAVYVLAVLVYAVALAFVGYKTGNVEDQVEEMSLSYTNALQLKQRYTVLKDREQLKFAALECWKMVAENMPETLTLDKLNFSEGKRLSLAGTAPAGQLSEINSFERGMSKAPGPDGQPFFNQLGGEHLTTHPIPGGGLGWSFSLELKRSEAL